MPARGEAEDRHPEAYKHQDEAGKNQDQWNPEFEVEEEVEATQIGGLIETDPPEPEEEEEEPEEEEQEE